MEVREAQALLASVVAADRAGAGREQLRAAMADLARLRAFLDGRTVALARRFEAASVVPEPELAPDDAGERVDFLRAHALVALTEGNGRRAGRPEIVVVVDTTAPDADGTPAVDWSLPVELPTSVLRRLWPTALIHPVALAGGVVVHAPGGLNLGRSTRLASRAQRRVLRALYPTCGTAGVRRAVRQLRHPPRDLVGSAGPGHNRPRQSQSL
jgi:hypothetical protein